MIASSRRAAAMDKFISGTLSSAEHLRTLGQPGETLFFGHVFRRWQTSGGRRRSVGCDLRLESGSIVWKKFEDSGRCKMCPSPAQNRLISCSLDGSARLWDVASGENLLTLRDFAAPYVYRARMSPDGRTLVCSGDDPRLSLRRLPPRSHDNDADWSVLFEDDFERDELGEQLECRQRQLDHRERSRARRARPRNRLQFHMQQRSPPARRCLKTSRSATTFDLALQSASRPNWSVESEPEWLIAAHIGRTGLSHNRGEKGFAVLILPAGIGISRACQKAGRLHFHVGSDLSDSNRSQRRASSNVCG